MREHDDFYYYDKALDGVVFPEKDDDDTILNEIASHFHQDDDLEEEKEEFVEDDIVVATQSDGTTMTATKQPDGIVSLKPEEPKKEMAFPANFDEDAITRYYAIRNKKLSHAKKVSLIERHRAKAGKPLKPLEQAKKAKKKPK